MPVYLFTYHAYQSWMPDRKEGYVRRHKGILLPNIHVADQYRERATEDEVEFDSPRQLVLIDELKTACEKQRCRRHYVATETTHVHVLVSWRDERPWMKLRNGLKQSLSRRLNREKRREHWLSEGASRKQVNERKHFDYLISTYLPSHSGWKWCEGREEPFR